ncbi:hypothetical protein HDV57DRAFT_182512 [Trichoderma longibrachiatum]
MGTDVLSRASQPQRCTGQPEASTMDGPSGPNRHRLRPRGSACVRRLAMSTFVGPWGLSVLGTWLLLTGRRGSLACH